MKKIILIVMCIGLISLVFAQSNLGTFKEGECISLYQMCDNCTYVNLTSIIQEYPNSTIIKVDETMTKDGVNHNYTFCNTSNTGDYIYNVCGDKDGGYECENINFKITMIGTEMTTGGSIIYFIFFGILILFFILIMIFISKLPGSNTKNEVGEFVSVSWLKYLRSVFLFVDWMILIAIFYISSNLAFAYLGETLFAQILFIFFRICFALTLPIVVVWFIWIFLNVLRDKRLKKMIEKGIHPSWNF